MKDQCLIFVRVVGTAAFFSCINVTSNLLVLRLLIEAMAVRANAMVIPYGVETVVCLGLRHLSFGTKGLIF